VVNEIKSHLYAMHVVQQTPRNILKPCDDRNGRLPGNASNPTNGP